MRRVDIVPRLFAGENEERKLEQRSPHYFTRKKIFSKHVILIEKSSNLKKMKISKYIKLV